MGRLVVVHLNSIIALFCIACAACVWACVFFSSTKQSISNEELEKLFQPSIDLDKLSKQVEQLERTIATLKPPKDVQAPLLTQLLNIWVSCVQNFVKAIVYGIFELFHVLLAWLHCFFNTITVATPETYRSSETCKPLFSALELWKYGIQCKVHEDSRFTCGWVGKSC